MRTKIACVLVVDDDIRMLRLMRRMLELESYRVLTASNGEAALGAFYEETPDIVLLDIIMPGLDGFTVCRRIREFSQIPIVMITARGSDEEKVEGLDAGADDYVTKPFSSKELVARVKAVLRRAHLWEERSEAAVRYADLVIDFAGRRVILCDQDVDLTATEYKLLSYLARNAGRVVTPDQMLENVWGKQYLGARHLLQVYMARLRQKLKDDARNPRFILTRPGIGYTMVKHL